VRLLSADLIRENSTWGSVKKMYGTKRPVSMLVFQFVRSSIKRYLHWKGIDCQVNNVRKLNYKR
jgi:hypothetical protein